MGVGVAPECGPIPLRTPGHTPNRPPYSFVRKPMIFLWGRFELNPQGVSQWNGSPLATKKLI
jgi:hypothetical protein